ncbi:MAG: membrane protein insertion efficiency factor YidD [Epsilonproteobacteria bacterium]|nr:membrane protein insertion efficiency factor YidD [Campylobacterota bacterium]
MRQILLFFLKIYQKVFTLLSFGSCRYYPTCSEYTKWQIEQNPSLIKALFFSVLRILRCNQFFKGGIDYPVVIKKFEKSLLKRDYMSKNKDISIKYWLVPKSRDKFYLIKSFKKEK